jgi:hypothetical protein
VLEDDLGFYLKPTKTQGVYVPRRIFDDATEAQQFWVLAQAYFQQVKKTITV